MTKNSSLTEERRTELISRIDRALASLEPPEPDEKSPASEYWERLMQRADVLEGALPGGLSPSHVLDEAVSYLRADRWSHRRRFRLRDQLSIIYGALCAADTLLALVSIGDIHLDDLATAYRLLLLQEPPKTYCQALAELASMDWTIMRDQLEEILRSDMDVDLLAEGSSGAWEENEELENYCRSLSKFSEMSPGFFRLGLSLGATEFARLPSPTDQLRKYLRQLPNHQAPGRLPEYKRLLNGRTTRLRLVPSPERRS